jgi:hypothetical protein
VVAAQGETLQIFSFSQSLAGDSSGVVKTIPFTAASQIQFNPDNQPSELMPFIFMTSFQTTLSSSGQGQVDV